MKRSKVRHELTGHFRLCPCSRCTTWTQRSSESCESCLGARQIVVEAPSPDAALQQQRILAEGFKRRTRLLKRARWGTGFEGFRR